MTTDAADAHAAQTFPYFDDAPDGIADVIPGLRGCARDAGTDSVSLGKAAASSRPGWNSADGDAAIGELRAIAAVQLLAARGLAAAGAALSGYWQALLSSRARVDAVRRAYVEASRHRDATLLAVSADHPLPADDASAAATGAERAFADAVTPLIATHRSALQDASTARSAVLMQLADGVESLRRAAGGPCRPGPVAAGGVRALLVPLLPSWGQQISSADRAATQLAAGRYLRPAARLDIMRRYSAQRDDPVFAAELLDRLGPRGFRSLAAAAIPPRDDPADHDTIAGYYGFLGSVLAAGTADQDEPVRGWLSALTAGLADPSHHHDDRVALGFVLRHGSYSAGALAILLPPFIAARSDRSAWVTQAFGDPLVGALRAASTDLDTSRRLLGDGTLLPELLARRWDDDGAALAAMITTAESVPDHEGAQLAQTVVGAVGSAPGALPPLLGAGLGTIAATFPAAMCRGLANPAAIPPEGRILGDAGDPRFGRAEAARVLYAAMHSETGTSEVYTGFAAYAAVSIASAGPGTASRLESLGKFSGRLSGLHSVALRDLADQANSGEAAQLKNRATWVTIAAVAASQIPIPKLPAVGQFVRGRATLSLTGWLRSQVYDKPVAKDSARRLSQAASLGEAEELASQQYLQQLVARAYPSQSIPEIEGVDVPTIVGDAFGAGRSDVSENLDSRLRR